MATKHTNALIESTKRKLATLRRKRVSKRVKENCGRCGGLGRIDAFYHVAAGVCFGCHGRGKMVMDVRIFEDPALDAQAQELERIIRDEVTRLESTEALRRSYLWDWQAAISEDERRSKVGGQRHLTASVGERVDIEGVVTCRKVLEGFYGASLLVLVETDAGEVVKTIGTGSGLWEVLKGDRVAFRGTIKAHEVYNGVPQSVLTRVKATLLQGAEA
jgi:hypothetical protein